MEVGQGPNWGCSAKEKKKEIRNYNLFCNNTSYMIYIQFRPMFFKKYIQVCHNSDVIVIIIIIVIGKTALFEPSLENSARFVHSWELGHPVSISLDFETVIILHSKVVSLASNPQPGGPENSEVSIPKIPAGDIFDCQNWGGPLFNFNLS
jgi:hypothetical protein